MAQQTLEQRKLDQQKTLLASLLASEKLIVQHQPVKTASFDLKQRILTLPVFKDSLMTPDMYDLFVGHEVSHAIFTPQNHADVVAQYLRDRYGSVRGESLFETALIYVNIVEDIRIERLIRNKYPGLTGPFYRAYNDLYNNKDFFGLKGQDPNTCREFPDRLNIYAKVGSVANISFDQDEEPYVQQAFSCVSFDDVVECALDLMKFMQTQQQRKQRQQEEDEDTSSSSSSSGPSGKGIGKGSGVGGGRGTGLNKGAGGGSTSTDDDDDSDDDEDKAESETEEDSEETEESETEEDSEEEDSEETEESETEEDSEEEDSEEEDSEEEMTVDSVYVPQTQTDSFDDFADGAASVTYMYKLTDELDTKQFVYSFESFHAALFKHFNNRIQSKGASLADWNKDVNEVVSIIEKTSKPIINDMVQEFKRKQAAWQQSKSQTSCRGDLDLKKLHLTKLSDDIFLRNTVLPDGKNHGLLMILDWSGSMNGKPIIGTLMQTINLIIFCNQMHIPYEVYMFTNRSSTVTACGDKTIPNKDIHGNIVSNDTIIPGDMRLVQLASSSQRLVDRKNAVRVLAWLAATFAKDVSRYYYNNQQRNEIYDCLPFDPSKFSFGSMKVPAWLGLSGTPLDSAIVGLASVHRQFVNKYKTDICHTIILTDGDGCTPCCKDAAGDWLGTTNYTFSGGNTTSKRKIIGIKPNKSGKILLSDKLKTYTETKALLEAYREITKSRIIGFYLTSDSYYVHQTGDKKSIDEFNKNGMAIITEEGYDKYYIINPKITGIKDSDPLSKVSQGNTKQVTKAFLDGVTSKKNARVFVKKFIEDIATHM